MKTEKELIEFLKTRNWVIRINEVEKVVTIKTDIVNLRKANNCPPLRKIKVQFGWKMNFKPQ